MGSIFKIVTTGILIYWLVGVLVDAGFDIHIYPEDWEIIFDWAVRMLIDLKDAFFVFINKVLDALHENIHLLK